MTKDEFLDWLDQFRHVTNIKAVVEERVWTATEFDRLKATLLATGRLRLKNEYKKRQAWG